MKVYLDQMLRKKFFTVSDYVLKQVAQADYGYCFSERDQGQDEQGFEHPDPVDVVSAFCREIRTRWP